MDNKCSKYEGLFVFSDDETLNQHISECEECRKQQEEQKRVSELIDEVKFYYLKKRKNRRVRIAAMCASFFLFISFLSVGLVMNNDDLMDTLQYGYTLSAEDLGFPVDSYGLLMVDE